MHVNSFSNLRMKVSQATSCSNCNLLPSTPCKLLSWKFKWSLKFYFYFFFYINQWVFLHYQLLSKSKNLSYIWNIKFILTFGRGRAMFAQTVRSLMQFLMKARSYVFALMPINCTKKRMQCQTLKLEVIKLLITKVI